MGFADSPATIDTLAGYDIRVSGWRWQWAVGLKGGTFPPHLDLNQQFESTADSYPAYPGEDVNGDSCACALVPVYRTSDGRFAKPDNLKPIFQPPVTASAVEVYRPEPIDWTPVREFLTEFKEQVSGREFVLTVPDGAFVVNVPETHQTFHVAAPNVTVEAAPAPKVTVQPTFAVESPTVNVSPPVVNVSAPEVSVSPNITVQPAKVQVIREKIIQKVRFRRNQSGQIETAEVDQ